MNKRHDQPGASERQRAEAEAQELSQHPPDAWARARAAVADERDRVADSRDATADDRDRLADSREKWLVDSHEEWLAQRPGTERLLAQLREANERLVITTVRADELAEQAEQARTAAADGEERFRSLVVTSAAIVWYADAQGRIHVDPDSWRTFTGLELGAAEEDRGWLSAVHPDDRDRARDLWTRATATGTAYECQHRLQTSDGGQVHVIAIAVPIARAGIVREWIGMMTDVTDRVKIDEARELFIAILGHDLRNPLSAIMGGAEVLRLRGVSAPNAQILSRITRSARRMELIIRDVMDFALGRLGPGIPISPIACDLGPLCLDLVGELQQAYPARVIQFAQHGDLHGTWDPARVEQVISNLVGNALTHGTDPIRVQAEGEADAIVLTVHNLGKPIPPSSIATLFEPFVRGEPTPSVSSPGLGLGLYIVREIVRAHGATIEVTSADGAGTRFTIRWPRTPSPSPRRAR